MKIVFVAYQVHHYTIIRVQNLLQSSLKFKIQLQIVTFNKLRNLELIMRRNSRSLAKSILMLCYIVFHFYQIQYITRQNKYGVVEFEIQIEKLQDNQEKIIRCKLFIFQLGFQSARSLFEFNLISKALKFSFQKRDEKMKPIKQYRLACYQTCFDAV